MRRLMLLAALVVASTCPGSRAMEIGANFWDVAWGGPTNDPFVDGHKNVTGDNPWKKEFLDEIRLYTTLRFMDWAKTNNAVKEHKNGTAWENRTKKSDPLQKPMAWEWMIALCNRVDRNLWVCVPHFADEHYMYELGRLIRENLDEDLKCYVEWSNETWNGMFAQAKYCNEQGQNLELPAGHKWANNEWYRGQMYHAQRTFEVFHQFERAFEGQRKRLVTVIGGTTVHAFAEAHIEAIDSRLLNPHGVKPDAYALAPYFGNGLDGSDPNIEKQVIEAIARRMEGVKRVETAVKAAGLDFITYEAGQHLKKNADIFCSSPMVYDAYMHYLAELEKHFSLCMQYTHNGTHSSNNAWGAKRYIGEPPKKAHKYRALYDYAVKSGQYNPQTGAIRYGR